MVWGNRELEHLEWREWDENKDLIFTALLGYVINSVNTKLQRRSKLACSLSLDNLALVVAIDKGSCMKPCSVSGLSKPHILKTSNCV